MGPAVGIADQHSVAVEIVSWLKPASVLGIGSGAAGLLDLLTYCGVTRAAHAASLEELACVTGRFDLAVHAGSMDPAMIRGAAEFTDRVLFFLPAVDSQCGPLLSALRIFDECGGFDEDALPIAYQDVDLCLKLRQLGYRVLFTPHARLHHHEATSKRPEDKDPRPSETGTFQTRWKAIIEHDPFYNPNLTRSEENYSYRRKR